MVKKAPTQTAIQKQTEYLVAAIRAAGTFESCIAYNMPAFRYKTKIVACYLACKNHLGFYPYSGNIVKQFKKELAGFASSSGSVQFPYDVKIPKGLIKKMVKMRMKEIEAFLRTKRK
jgi:uncharacterized protein YdhG (YjbR/CyaY superfamily)